MITTNIVHKLWQSIILLIFERDIFNHLCSCPTGFDGMNCEMPGCGGNVMSEETRQTISINLTAYERDCTWNINSPKENDHKS